jgi:Xaa-Pro dipeptidase
MFDAGLIQESLREFGLDAWLFYDFRGSNVLTRRVLDLEMRTPTTRRFLYLVPAVGSPRKLVHRIESATLDHLPGEATVYLRWQDFESGVGALVQGLDRIAMEYSPRNANPYISRVDAGTIELVQSFGVKVVSSGDLIQRFEASWDDLQWAMHLDADRHTCAAYDLAWSLIASRVRDGRTIRETEVQAAIMAHFKQCGMTTYHPPIVGVGPNSGDPHYEPIEGKDAEIGRDNFVLIDLWAKMDRPRAVYSDLTRVGYTGETVPEVYQKVFQIVSDARDAAIDRVRQAFASGTKLHGFEVDRAARDVIDRAGYGHAFIHRTGHNIGQETHGNGANMDDLETHDERLVLPRTCFSIEPGIYLPEFGVRSEVNVYIAPDNTVHVTGEPQREVLAVLASQ